MARMNRRKKEQLEMIADWVKEKLEDEGTGHDWLHITRVRRLSLLIAEAEGADLFITEAAALVHDLIDEKLSPQYKIPLRELRRRFSGWGIDNKTAEEIISIITKMSFRDRETYKGEKLSAEGMAVQDADRLDAIGAVGIARTFMYAGAKGQAMYREDAGDKGVPSAVGHFYEKLLLLKDLMNTKTGRRLAEHRHQVMAGFLHELKNECGCGEETALIDQESRL
ncbi:HD domain-containing protein [Bacillus glycinifermentans]|uniref:HD domain-containing protein n=1 Tax=Bacillus glycinifermentans TaxID=1664069 RepID=UPI0022E8230A|nr:HD domain-containing protein [Bacillus glycinifermentans]